MIDDESSRQQWTSCLLKWVSSGMVLAVGFCGSAVVLTTRTDNTVMKRF